MPTPRPTRCSASAAWWPAHIPNNAGSLEPLTVSAPDGMHPQRAQAQRRCASRHIIGQMLPDVVLRLPAPDHSRSRAGRRHVVPVEHQRARPDARRRGRQLRLRHGDHLATAAPARGPTRTGCRPPPIPAACAARRSRSPRPDAADLLAQGAAPRFRAAPAARAAGWARSSEIESGIDRAVRPSGGVRPHRSSGARPRRRRRRRGGLSSALKSGQTLQAARASSSSRRATAWWS